MFSRAQSDLGAKPDISSLIPSPIARVESAFWCECVVNAWSVLGSISMPNSSGMSIHPAILAFRIASVPFGRLHVATSTGLACGCGSPSVGTMGPL